jgi:hypothetical protein
MKALGLSLKWAYRWAMIRAWWWCWWHFPKNGAMRCQSRDKWSGELFAVTAKDMNGKLLKVFWEAL